MNSYFLIGIIFSLILIGLSLGNDQINKQRGLLVIPGLGRPDRLDIVVHNLQSLSKKGSFPIVTKLEANDKEIEWDCVIYIYASRLETSFWSKEQKINYIYSQCKIIENIGKKVTESMYMIQPALMKHSYQYVFLLLDDIKIPNDNAFDLTKAMNILICNQLTVLSPRIVGANKGGGQKFRNIMQALPEGNSLGYVSKFVEIFAWVMTFPAYQALWELLCPEINPYAWGYDFWYNNYASKTVKDHRMGIASILYLEHHQESPNSGLGRTDNTKEEIKWNAVLAQERHYRLYKGINLSQHRKNLGLANTSWNGAVINYLRTCPI